MARWKSTGGIRTTTIEGALLTVELPADVNPLGYWSWSVRMDGKVVASGGCPNGPDAERAAVRAHGSHALRARTRLTPTERKMLLAIARRYNRTGDERFEWSIVQTALFNSAQPPHLNYAQIASAAKALAAKGLIVSGDIGDEFGSLTPTGRLWAR